MPKYITIPYPHKRLAKNLFEPLSSCQNAVGVDLLTTTTSIKPFPSLISAVAIPAHADWTAVFPRNSLRASDGKIYVIGSATISAATNLALWTATALAASPTWALAHNVAGTPSAAIAEYKDGVFVGHGTTLVRWGNLSGSPSASNITTGLTTGLDILLNHVGLGKLFFVHNSGKTVGSYDAVTAIASTLSLLNIQAGERIVSMKEWGRYVLLGIRSTDSSSSSGNGKSRVVVWDGSDSAIVDQSVINDMGLGSIQVVGQTCIAICTTMPSASSVVRLRIYQGTPGGEMRLAEWKDWRNAKGPIGLNDNAVDISMDKIWFAPEFLSGTTDGGIFVYDPDQRNLYRALVPVAGTTDDTFTSLRMFGTNSLITYSNQSGTRIMNSIGVSSSAQTGTFETNVFPLNGGLKNKIKTIFISHAPLPTSSGFTVSIRQFGNYPFGTTVPSNTFTVTIASPGVFTKSSHGFVVGDSLRFSTTGALPTGLTAGTTYYVISAGLTADAFEVSATLGGAAVNTTGSQSGTHSVDGYRDLVIPDGSGSATGRTQATDNATITEINSPLFVDCKYAQIKIAFDDVTSISDGEIEIATPILIELSQ